MGYYQAGFDIVGVDNRPQPNYPFDFILADALTFPLENFDAIHASPPCQAHTVANNVYRKYYPDLIPATRERLEQFVGPWVIENVEGAPLKHNAILLCGLAFGLGVKRHRYFETNWNVWNVPRCPPDHPGDWVSVFGNTVQRGKKHFPVERGREAMGIPWMTRKELSQAIPPAYTEFIGKQMRHLATIQKAPVS